MVIITPRLWLCLLSASLVKVVHFVSRLVREEEVGGVLVVAIVAIVAFAALLSVVGIGCVG
jgi:hypothetical protein